MNSDILINMFNCLNDYDKELIYNLTSRLIEEKNNYDDAIDECEKILKNANENDFMTLDEVKEYFANV